MVPSSGDGDVQAGPQLAFSACRLPRGFPRTRFQLLDLTLEWQLPLLLLPLGDGTLCPHPPGGTEYGGAREASERAFSAYLLGASGPVAVQALFEFGSTFYWASEFTSLSLLSFSVK